MKTISFYLILAFILIQYNAQSQDYYKVDSVIQTYPRTFPSPDKISELINRDFVLPAEKARAIFTWIALNISYDINALRSTPRPISYSYRTEEERLMKEQKIKEDLAKATLKSKKAVCQGYSTLFKVICDQVGLECEIVSGTSKTKPFDIGVLPKISDHAWNCVKIDNDWKLVDVTWGSGYLNETMTQFVKEFTDFYFFTQPHLFFMSHYPENKDWLFFNITEKEFANLPLYYSYYFKRKIELVEPKIGIISTPRNNLIRIVLKNVGNGSLSYNYHNEREGKIISGKIENEQYIYEIECKRKTGSYLTLFLDNTGIITFKIK